MAGKACIDVLTVLQESRTLMMDTCLEGSEWVIAGNQAFDVDREIGTLTQVDCADGMNVVSSIMLPICAVETLVGVGLGSEMPCVLTRCKHIISGE